MNNTLFRNSKGQILLENVLLTVGLIILFNVTMKGVRDNEWVSRVVNAPWKKLAGMIESGVWDQKAQARLLHPNHLGRNLSMTKVAQ